MGSPPEYIVTDPHGLRICCEDIAASEQVGFDTEFVGEESYQPQLCLLQLATPRALYVIDPFDCGPLEELWSLLASPTRLVIVHAGREEVRFIQGAAGRAPRQLFDVQIAAGLVGFNYPVGYGPLVHNVLGRKLRKNETLTDWRRRPLSQGQLRYAFDDVRDLLALWRELEALLKRRRRMSWAQEEFAAWTHRWLQRSTDNERWRKLKGIGGLDPARLAIVRELYFWR
ncbi:MAG: ribonuclease D, partial [Nitrospira sp.]|nr:ribonuclease D [Nitrospira sp.]